MCIGPIPEHMFRILGLCLIAKIQFQVCVNWNTPSNRKHGCCVSLFEYTNIFECIQFWIGVCWDVLIVGDFKHMILTVGLPHISHSIVLTSTENSFTSPTIYALKCYEFLELDFGYASIPSIRNHKNCFEGTKFPQNYDNYSFPLTKTKKKRRFNILIQIERKGK